LAGLFTKEKPKKQPKAAKQVVLKMGVKINLFKK